MLLQVLPLRASTAAVAASVLSTQTRSKSATTRTNHQTTAVAAAAAASSTSTASSMTITTEHQSSTSNQTLLSIRTNKTCSLQARSLRRLSDPPILTLVQRLETGRERDEAKGLRNCLSTGNLLRDLPDLANEPGDIADYARNRGLEASDVKYLETHHARPAMAPKILEVVGSDELFVDTSAGHSALASATPSQCVSKSESVYDEEHAPAKALLEFKCEFDGSRLVVNGVPLDSGDGENDAICWKLRLLRSVILDCNKKVVRCIYQSGRTRMVEMSKAFWHMACALATTSSAESTSLKASRRAIRILRQRVLPYISPSADDIVLLETTLQDIETAIASLEDQLNVRAQEALELQQRTRQLLRELAVKVINKPQLHSLHLLQRVLTNIQTDLREFDRSTSMKSLAQMDGEKSTKWVQMQAQKPVSYAMPRQLLVHAQHTISEQIKRRQHDPDLPEMKAFDERTVPYAELTGCEKQLEMARKDRNAFFALKMFAMNVRELIRGSIRDITRVEQTESGLHRHLLNEQQYSRSIDSVGAAELRRHFSTITAHSTDTDDLEQWDTASSVSQLSVDAESAQQESVNDEVRTQLITPIHSANRSLLQVEAVIMEKYGHLRKTARPQTIADKLPAMAQDIDCYMDMLRERVVATSPSLDDASRRNYVRPAIEKVVFPMLQSVILSLYETAYAAKDNELHEQMKRHRFIQPQHLSVRRECCVLNDQANTSFSSTATDTVQLSPVSSKSMQFVSGRDAVLHDDYDLANSNLSHLHGTPHHLHGIGGGVPLYSTSLQEFLRFPGLVVPTEKLECILATLRDINRCAMEIQRTYSDSADSLGCEELVLLFSCIIVRSGCSRLFSQCCYLADYVDKQLLLGEYGYGLVTLQMTLEFLCSMKPSDVSL